MAQTVFFTYPLDTPRQIRPGVLYREADWHGSDRWAAVPEGSADNLRAGNLSTANIPNFESRPLTTPGAPYVLKR